MKIAVCDDDKAAREELFRLIKSQVPDARIYLYSNGKEMLNARQDFDISFLDIKMGSESGIDIAKYIRKQEENCINKSIIIFVTGYREYMEMAFDVNAFHYLVKPVDSKKFLEVFNHAYKEISAILEQSRKYIIVKSLGTHHKILLKNIYYIESMNKKVIFHTTDGILEAYGKISELSKELGNSFYRCHRCYLVNMEKISAYNTDTIQVTNGNTLVLSRKKYPDFIKTYIRYAKNGGIASV